MGARLKLNQPQKAKEYFEAKMSFTTGPVELDYYRSKHVQFKLIDVRAREDYEEEHIPGAINLPEEKWNSLEGLSKDLPNIVYCYSQVCHLAARASVQFASAGFSVMEMEGGFKAWKEHNLPTDGTGNFTVAV